MAVAVSGAMAEKIQCSRCGRLIDAIARICPFCNLDRAAPSPVAPPPVLHDFGQPAGAESTSPSPSRGAVRERSVAGQRLLVIFAAIGLMVATFAIGGLYYKFGNTDRRTENESVPEAAPQVAQSTTVAGDLTFASQPDPTSAGSRVITTAPIPGADQQLPAEFQRRDATALPSTQYSSILEQARRDDRARAVKSAAADPRTINTSPFSPLPVPTTRRDTPRDAAPIREARPDVQRNETPPREASVARTSPSPTYQPLPRMDLRELKRSGSVRLNLTIGADGRVKEVDILETLPGVTPKMVAAVQKWRFKPATENGQPVQGTYLADVFFKADDDD